MPTPSPTAEALREIHRLASRYDNGDEPGEERAAEALIAGQAAYWSVTGSTNGLSLMRDYVNVAGSIAEGLKAFVADFPHSETARRIPAFLDKLIPLNEVAVADLGSAYMSMLSTWRDGSELRERNFLFAETAMLSPRVTEAA